MESNQRKIGVALSYITLAIQMVVGFVYVKLFVLFLGESENGIYQAVGSIAAYLAIMDFGLSSTIIRYYSRYKSLDDKKNMENVLSLSAIIYTVITVFILIAGVVVYFMFEPIFGAKLSEVEIISAKKVWAVLVINIGITIPTKIFNAVIVSHEKFVFLKLITLAQTVLQPVFIISALFIMPTAFVVVLIQTIMNVLIITIQIFYCFKKLDMKMRFHYLDQALFKSMLGFSAYTFLGALMDQLFWRSNPIILTAVSGTIAAGVYGSSMIVFNSYQSLSTVITSVFLPKVTGMAAQDASPEEMTSLFIRIGRIQSLLLSCVLSGYVIFGQQFIYLWLGDRFADAYWIILFLIAPITVDLIQNIGITILQAVNKLAFRSLSFLAVSLISIGIAVPVARIYGGIGAAFVTGTSCLVANLLLNGYYAKKIKLGIGKFWKETSKIFLYSAVTGFIGTFLNLLPLPNSYIGLLVKIIVYLMLFVAGLWRFVMNSDEKELFSGILAKIFGVLKKRKKA